MADKFVNAEGAKIIADEIKKRYTKPTAGIPKTDLDSSVQTSLGKADTALQTHQPLTDYAKKTDLAAKYEKPDDGIPITDLTDSVQTSLGKADSALQTESDPTVPDWAKQSTKPSYSATEITGLTDVSNLKNYYSKTEVDQKVSAIPKFAISVVEKLPTSGVEATVYLVKSGDDEQNMYTEYIYVNESWEKLGTQGVDLTGYAKKSDIPTAMTSAEVQALFND